MKRPHAAIPCRGGGRNGSGTGMASGRPCPGPSSSVCTSHRRVRVHIFLWFKGGETPQSRHRAPCGRLGWGACRGRGPNSGGRTATPWPGAGRTGRSSKPGGSNPSLCVSCSFGTRNPFTKALGECHVLRPARRVKGWMDAGEAPLRKCTHACVPHCGHCGHCVPQGRGRRD